MSIPKPITTKLLTTAETYALTKILRDTKLAKFEFFGEKDSHILVKWRGIEVFQALKKDGDAWIVSHRSDLFIPA